MRLITALAAGVRGAESGTVLIRRRGTSTNATCYPAFEGGSSFTTGSGLALDANGGVTVYVDEVVDVTVRDASGNTVRTFTEGESAGGVEVRSQSITGVDYSTGQSGASKPVPLSAALDKLYTSFGALDFNVLVGGVSTKMSTAIAALDRGIFNVKAYGAVGDGVTQDASAINAAISAATAAGGIVFFPPGTYITNASMSMLDNVYIVGSGRGATVVWNTGLSGGIADDTLDVLSNWSVPCGVADITLKSTNGRAVAFSGRHYCTFKNCQIEGGNSHGNLMEWASGGDYNLTTFIDTKFIIGNAAKPAAYITSFTEGYVSFIGCDFEAASGQSADMVTSAGGNLSASFIGCRFNHYWASGTFNCITNQSTAPRLFVVGCHFGLTNGNTVTALKLNANLAGSACIVESGNIFECTNAYDTYTFAGNPLIMRLEGRNGRVKVVADDSATITLDSNIYSTIRVQRASAGAQTINLKAAPPGSRFTLIFDNQTGGASGTYTMGANVYPATSGAVATNNRLDVLEFVAEYKGGFRWVLLNAGSNDI